MMVKFLNRLKGVTDKAVVVFVSASDCRKKRERER
jgi:hypothetical protein